MKTNNGTGNDCSVPSENYLPKDLSLLNIIQSTEMGPFMCEKCEEAFETIDEVRTHINSYHGTQKASIFRLECWSNVNNHSEYIEWQKTIVNIPHVTFVSMEEKEINESIQKLKTKTKIQKAKAKMLSLFKKTENKKEGENSFGETFRITRTRSSGPNILETERSIFIAQDDGTKKKTVIKDVFAKGSLPKKNIT